MNANAIVQKLWRLCAVLRKDGITYQQYVTELTYLLFLKMMAERDRETGSLPKGLRWGDLLRARHGRGMCVGTLGCPLPSAKRLRKRLRNTPVVITQCSALGFTKAEAEGGR